MTIEKKSGVLVIQNATLNHSSVRFATRVQPGAILSTLLR